MAEKLVTLCVRTNAADDYVPLLGEICYDVTKKILVVGDNATPFSQLPSIANINIENGSGTGAIQQKRGGIAKGGNSAAFNSGIAKGGSAFAEGNGIAMVKGTHAEGEWSYADGWCAHAEGSTNAHTSYKHTEGLANSDKDQTIHETGYGEFIYEAVDSKPSYQQVCIDTQVPESGQPYILYFIELENGGHSLITSKNTTAAQYEEYSASDIYTRTVDAKNVFEVYKTGSLANGVYIDKLKQYIIAYLAQLATGDTSNYTTMNTLLGESYKQTLIDTASQLSTFKTIVAIIFGLNIEQQQQVLALVASVDALASVVIILAFSLADFTALYAAIISANQQAALNTIIRNSDLLDDNAMLSPVSLASGTANEIFSMAAAAIGSKNRIGSVENIASGTGSEAVGVNNIIEGQNSIAVGDSNKIQKANSSGAFGNSNEVKPYDNSYEMITAFALGRFLKNMYSGSLVIGSYNDSEFDPSVQKLFQVGNGTAENARSNAFEVLADGRAKIKAAAEDSDDGVNKQFLLANSSRVFTHHFDVNLGHDNLAAIPVGYRVDLNFNIISSDETAWETLSELDGKGYIISAFGLLYQGTQIASQDQVFEAKLFYSALNGGTLLLNVHNILNGSITATAVVGLNSYQIQDSVSKI